jgi:hypothetical protein
MTQEIVSLETRRAALQSWILVYVRNGYQVVAQTDTTAQPVKPAMKRGGRAYLEVDEFGVVHHATEVIPCFQESTSGS